ncbi:MAG: class I SAM-dependent methyltransferase [Halobacteriaceae archaeon]
MSREEEHREARRRVGRAYDALGDAYRGERTADADGGTLPVVRAFGSDLEAGSLVLDAGCGPGVTAAVLGDRHRVVGLDISREQLALARETAPAATLCRGDLTALPFGAGRLDALLELHAIIHVPREQHRAVYAEFARVLRPGGEALVAVRTDRWEGTTPDWLGAGVEMAWSFPGRERSVEHIEAAGFGVVDAWHIDEEGGYDCLRLALR